MFDLVAVDLSSVSKTEKKEPDRQRIDLHTPDKERSKIQLSMSVATTSACLLLPAAFFCYVLDASLMAFIVSRNVGTLDRMCWARAIRPPMH